MSKRFFQVSLALLTCALASASAQRAFAHPLGNFTINHYSRLELNPAQIRLVYIVDRAEIPAFQEREKIDLNRDGTLSPEEREAYLSAERIRLQNHLHLSLNGAPLSLQLTGQSIEFPAGQGGLFTQRITLTYQTEAALAINDNAAINYADENFSDRLGWKEIVVRADNGITLSGDAPTQDVSQGLTQYPQDMLNSPLNVAGVNFTLTSVGSIPATAPVLGRAQSIAASSVSFGNRPAGADPFTDLINLPELTWGAALVALGLAFVWGAAHALSPGHGKTIVAAYLIGQRATVKHALFLGLTTTITHTTGVFVLGLITLFASQFIVPDRLYPWLEVISGVLVVVLGVSLMGNRVLNLMKPATAIPGHTHDDVAIDGMHEHGDGRYHSHTPPAKVGWRNLLALGISGGLLPCPSALVVMLSAIALQRVAFGLLLILVFSAGLAGVLIAIGVALVHANSLVNRISQSRLSWARPLLRVAPVFSALVITLAGLAITVRAVALTVPL